MSTHDASRAIQPPQRRSRSGWILAALIVVLVALVGWRLAASRATGGQYFGAVVPPANDIFRFSNGAEPETIDPGLMSGQPDGRIARTLFEGLLVPDPVTLEPIPGVAESWELSPDGLTYTFHLRQNATWTNGDPVTAHDFVYAWTRVLHPDTAARYADLFYVIRNARAYKAGDITDPMQVGIHADDDWTLRVELAAPTPYFAQLVTFYPFLPVHPATVEEHGDRWTRSEFIVTNGAYRLVQHRQNDKFVFEKFHGYWDAADVKLDGIIAYSIDDLATMLNMYRAGMTDWNPSGYLPAQFIPYVMHYKDYSSGPYLGSYFYSVVVDKPPFNDKRVRKALAYAIDRAQICEHIMHNARSPSGNIVSHGFSDYPYPPGITFDPAKARQLLAEAGYPNGSGFPSVSILFNTSEDHRKIAEAIQAMWKEHLGIAVQLQNQEWATYLRNTIDKNYEIARRAWIADYKDPNTFLYILRTGDGNNRSGWGNPEYDALIAAAGRELDPTERMRLLAQAETIALDEMPFLPIFAYRTTEFVAPYVRGLHSTATDTHMLRFVSFERGGGTGVAAGSASQ